MGKKQYFGILILILISAFLGGSVRAGNLEWFASAYPICDFDGQTPLWGSFNNSGCLAQLIWVGPNGKIEPPAIDGSPGGDDLLVEDSTGGQNPTWIGHGLGPGGWDIGKFFVSDITYSLPAGSYVYCRAFNTSSEWIGPGVHYGESSLYRLTGAVGESWDVTGQGSFSTNQVLSRENE